MTIVKRHLADSLATYHDRRQAVFFARAVMSIQDRDWYKDAHREREQRTPRLEPTKPQRSNMSKANAVLSSALAVYGAWHLAHDVMRWLHL